MTLTDLIARELRMANALTAAEIAARVCAHREHVLEALRELEDEGRVVMRNGFYRITEKERAET